MEGCRGGGEEGVSKNPRSPDSLGDRSSGGSRSKGERDEMRRLGNETKRAAGQGGGWEGRSEGNARKEGGET